MPHTYAVGKPYIPGRTTWPDGTAHFDAAGTQLVLFLATPSADEIAGVRRGRASFALVSDGDALFFLYQFGAPGRGIPWGDAPYSPHLVTEDTDGAPSAMPALPTPTSRYLLTVVLVDAATGLIAALRQVTLEPAFSRELAAQVADLASRPWTGQADYDRQLAAVYATYSTEQLLALAVARMDVPAVQ